MTCLVSAKDIASAMEYCGFRNVPDWSRHVLVVWPHSADLVNILLEYSCTVTIVVADMAEYQRLKSSTEWVTQLRTRTVRIVYGDPHSYVAASPLQHFVAIFISDPHAMEQLWATGRRAITWNGSLNCFGYSRDMAKCREKSIGWMIMSYPRCGTHMLVSSLNTHPDLTCYGEAFNPATPAGSHMFESVPQVLEKSWTTSKTGFAVHASIDRMGHPLNMADSMYGYTDFWKHIPDFTPTILLTRRNLLARYVSQLTAMRTGIWNSTDPEHQHNVYASVYVDISAFTRDMKYVQDCWDNAAAYFKYALPVVYEDMVADFDGTMQKVQDYLQVPYVPLTPETLKISVTLEESIENYVQVRAWCRRMNYSHFLLEDSRHV